MLQMSLLRHSSHVVGFRVLLLETRTGVPLQGVGVVYPLEDPEERPAELHCLPRHVRKAVLVGGEP